MSKTILKVWTGTVWDALNPETSADCVKLANGKTVEEAFKSIGTLSVNIKNGENGDAVQQVFIESGTEKGSKAYGKYSAAFNKDNKAYQRSATAIGGGTQAGMSLAEYLALNPGSTSSDYNASNSFAFASGQENKSLGLAAFTGGGYKNIVEGLYNATLGGGAHSVQGRFNAIVGGYGNILSTNADSSAVLDGYHNLVDSANSGAGGSENEVYTSNTHAFGIGLKAHDGYGPGRTLLGRYNAPSYALFQIGGGDSDAYRRNIFEVFADGTIKAPAEPKIPEALVNKKYVDDVVANTTTGETPDLSNYVQKSTTYPDLLAVYGRGTKSQGFPEQMFSISYTPSWGSLVRWGDPNNIGADNGGNYNTAAICCPEPKQPYQTANKKYVDDNASKKLYKHNITLEVYEHDGHYDDVYRSIDLGFSIISSDPMAFDLEKLTNGDKDYSCVGTAEIYQHGMYTDDGESAYGIGVADIAIYEIYLTVYGALGTDGNGNYLTTQVAISLELIESQDMQIYVEDIVEEL